MQAITKIIIFIVGISVLAGIIGASVYVRKNGLLQNSSSHNSSNQLTNDTIVQTIPHETTTVSELQPDQTTDQPKRAKRAIIFRPLFVYRQQQIKKQRLSEERQQQYLQQMSTTTQRPRTQRPKYASNYPYMS
ncbi:uncharacterized protein LOC109418023 [Aedes albopictus]|uniref:Putative secreted protein n=1 Tax=Aedes albopictus TaxID=7160 RepID=A0A023EE99_AEDAL|nr:uncharacterized protein LOC109418023 [Aedes albopictus]